MVEGHQKPEDHHQQRADQQQRAAKGREVS